MRASGPVVSIHPPCYYLRLELPATTGTGVLPVAGIDVETGFALTPAEAVERGLLDPQTSCHVEGPR